MSCTSGLLGGRVRRTTLSSPVTDTQTESRATITLSGLLSDVDARGLARGRVDAGERAVAAPDGPDRTGADRDPVGRFPTANGQAGGCAGRRRSPSPSRCPWEAGSACRRRPPPEITKNAMIATATSPTMPSGQRDRATRAGAAASEHGGRRCRRERGRELGRAGASGVAPRQRVPGRRHRGTSAPAGLTQAARRHGTGRRVRRGRGRVAAA